MDGSTKAGSKSQPVIPLVAALAAISGLIHVSAAVDHYSEYKLYTVFFVALAAVQIGWSAAVLRRPSRAILIFGMALGEAVVVLWIASRTTGVPIAPQPWVPEPIGVPDATATVDELVTILAAASLLPHGPIRSEDRTSRALPAIMLATLMFSVMYGVGAHAS